MQISCTRILIGVQGAGMHWHVFQPDVGAVLELGWTDWPPGMYTRLAKRRGLLADKLTTNQFDVDWVHFAKANGKGAMKMTDAQKAAAFNFTGPGWTYANPSKSGIGVFDVTKVTQKVRAFLKRFRKKGIHL